MYIRSFCYLLVLKKIWIDKFYQKFTLQWGNFVLCMWHLHIKSYCYFQTELVHLVDPQTTTVPLTHHPALNIHPKTSSINTTRWCWHPKTANSLRAFFPISSSSQLIKLYYLYVLSKYVFVETDVDDRIVHSTALGQVNWYCAHQQVNLHVGVVDHLARPA